MKGDPIRGILSQLTHLSELCLHGYHPASELATVLRSVQRLTQLKRLSAAILPLRGVKACYAPRQQDAGLASFAAALARFSELQWLELGGFVPQSNDCKSPALTVPQALPRLQTSLLTDAKCCDLSASSVTELEKRLAALNALTNLSLRNSVSIGMAQVIQPLSRLQHLAQLDISSNPLRLYSSVLGVAGSCDNRIQALPPPHALQELEEALVALPSSRALDVSNTAQGDVARTLAAAQDPKVAALVRVVACLTVLTWLSCARNRVAQDDDAGATQCPWSSAVAQLPHLQCLDVSLNTGRGPTVHASSLAAQLQHLREQRESCLHGNGVSEVHAEQLGPVPATALHL